MANVITLAMLVEKNACARQVEMFKRYFGKSVKICQNICDKYSSEFDIDWAAENLLNEVQHELYYTIRAQAWKAYNAIEWRAWEKYRDWDRTISETCNPRGVPPMAEYKAVESAAVKKYEATKEAAHKAYNKKRARAFCLAYNS